MVKSSILCSYGGHSGIDLRLSLTGRNGLFDERVRNGSVGSKIDQILGEWNSELLSHFLNLLLIGLGSSLLLSLGNNFGAHSRLSLLKHLLNDGGGHCVLRASCDKAVSWHSKVLRSYTGEEFSLGGSTLKLCLEVSLDVGFNFAHVNSWCSFVGSVKHSSLWALLCSLKSSLLGGIFFSLLLSSLFFLLLRDLLLILFLSLC